MPRGYRGKHAASYLHLVAKTQEEAFAMLNPPPGNPPGVPNIPSPPQDPQTIRLPHQPSTAHSGGHSTGDGSSANMVADCDMYNAFSQAVFGIDDEISFNVFHTAKEIADICQTVFIMPSVVPAVQDFAAEIQDAMKKVRNGAHDLAAETRTFSNKITSIE